MKKQCENGHSEVYWITNSSDTGNDDLIGQTGYCMVCRQIALEADALAHPPKEAKS